MTINTKLNINGRPEFLLGVNYWSRGGGPRMWERFDHARVDAELSQMRSVGLNVCRSFVFLQSFMPSPGTLDQNALDRLENFFQLCDAKGLAVIPTALVGHMSGENFDFVGQNGRSPYTDAELIAWQQMVVRALATCGRTHASVIAYLASNEMPYWGGESTPETVAAWATHLRDTLHATLDEKSFRPFGLGDGVMNLGGGQNGFDVDRLASIVDFVGPHTYYSDSDPYRQALNAEYCVRSLSRLGLPVLFEEFGCSSTQASEENQARYYRETIHSCLSGGAAGALGWCFSDFDLSQEDPYSHHAFELGFGVTRADGSEKPVCDELRATRALLDQVDFASFATQRPNVAIIVPSYFNRQYPFSWEDRARMRRTLLQAYVLCVKAGLETELVAEDTRLDGYRLVIVPACQKLREPTWISLREHAQRGNTIYWSYFSGDINFHQGAWCHSFTEFTGCTHQLRYACYDLPPDSLVIEGTTPQGKKLRLQLQTLQNALPFPRSFLPIAPLERDGVDVLARDNHNRPCLVRHRLGNGNAIFCNYPLEYYLAEQPEINRKDDTHELYRELAAIAGIEPQVRRDNPAVQLRIASDCNGTFLWVFNRAWDAVTVTLDTPGGNSLYGSQQTLTEGTTTLSLEPKQVSVFRLRSEI